MKKAHVIRVLRLLNLHLKHMATTQPLMEKEFTDMLELNKDMLRAVRKTNSNDMSEVIDEEILLSIIESILLPYGADFNIRYIKKTRKNQVTYM